MKNYTLLIFCLLVCPDLSSQGLYDIETLRSIYIDFKNDNYHEVLVEGWETQSGHREPASVELDGTVYEDVAIRYKGNATFSLANQGGSRKMPLNLDINDIIDDQEIMGFNKIKLANSYFDPSLIRDVFGMQIYREYMPAPEANYMKVYVEGDYLGVYPNTESINKQFLKKHFDYKNGTLFKCDPESQFGSNVPWESPDLAWYGPMDSTYFARYDLKSDEGWEDLVELVDVLNNDPDNLDQVLNIDRALWYLAVNTVITNYDSYNGFFIHNFYLYKHENGLFQFIPWDVSESFVGLLWYVTREVQGDQVYSFDYLNRNDPFGENRGMMKFIENNDQYRKQYLAHIRTIRDEVLNNDDLTSDMLNLQSIIEEAQEDDDSFFFRQGRFHFDQAVESDIQTFGVRVAGVNVAAEKRKAFLDNDAEVSLVPPTIDQVDRSVDNPTDGEAVYVTATVGNAEAVDLMVTTSIYSSHFKANEMFDDGNHGDALAGDGIYGALVPFSNSGDHVKYYIRAQNDDAMMLNPQRAEYVFYEFTVDRSTKSNDLPISIARIGPNPTEDFVIIHWGESAHEKDLNFRVVDFLGRPVSRFSKGVNQKKTIIDLRKFSGSQFLIHIEDFAPVAVFKI